MLDRVGSLARWFVCLSVCTGAGYCPVLDAAAVEAATPPVELTTLRGVQRHASGLDDDQPEGWKRHDPSNIIQYDGRYLLWVTGHVKGNNGFSDCRIILLSSPDGLDWRFEQIALVKNPLKAWDDGGVLTSYVVPWEGKYYLFYTGVDERFKDAAKDRRGIGYAVSGSPHGPWERPADNQILLPGPEGDFDDLCADDANVVRHGNEWYLYYKGRTTNGAVSGTQIGLATSKNLTGPYVKRASNPLFTGHAFTVTKYVDGVMALTGGNHPGVLWSRDWLHFVEAVKLKHKSTGVYNPADFEAGGGEGRINWFIDVVQGVPRRLHRVDLEYAGERKSQGNSEAR